MTASNRRHIGFSGTRDGLTEGQIGALFELLTGRTADCAGDGWWLHHGCCQGADAQAHGIALELGMRIVAHPPLERRYMAELHRFWTIRHPLPYLERNRHIVEASAELIACPAGPERLHSGTWSTVRYARYRARPVRPVTIIWPSGTLERPAFQ